MKVVIALGSNSGTDKATLIEAIDQSAAIITVTKVSTFHETAPVGGPETACAYLNAVLIGEKRT
jgi:2-amino-4-hydroxy-6-hydroxymethyldihydropteridine diphosphokinase